MLREVLRGDTLSLPAAPGGVGRAYFERLAAVAIPADSQANDPYQYGITGEFSPTPGALVSAVWSFELEVGSTGTRSWRYHLDNGGPRDAGSTQSNTSVLVDPKDVLASPLGVVNGTYWRPRTDPVSIATGLRHSGAAGQTGAATIKNQRLLIWEIAPENL